MIAEWEPTKFMWVPWGEGHELNSPPLEDLVILVTKELIPFVKVKMLVPDSTTILRVKQRLQKEGLDTGLTEFMVANPPGAPTDPSPVLLVNEIGELATIDFNWTGYGLDPEKKSRHTQRGEKFDVEMAARLGIPVLAKSNLVWEGGAKENNSKGVLLLVEQTELHRNPTWTKEQIEKEHVEKINLTKIVWLKKGLWEDEVGVRLPGGYYPMGTVGHIDEFCRFVNDSTIMLAQVTAAERDADSIHAENYKRMEENYAVLKNATNYNGRPFHIIRVPVPEHYTYQVKYEDMQPWMRNYFPDTKPGQIANGIATSSYLNFIIANDVVIVAKYWKKGRSELKRNKDRQVLQIFKKAFPGKTIIQIDMEGYNNGGGGLHCATYNEHVGKTK